MCSQPSFMEFQTFYGKVQRFFEGNLSPWAQRLLFEAMRNTSFISDVGAILDKTTKKINYKELDDLIQLTRSRTVLYLQKARQEKDLDRKFNIVSTMMAYLGLTECLHEHGPFTERIFDDLKKEFRNEYLLKLQEVDKDYLSADTQKLYHTKQKKKWPDNDAICRYLVLKKWQDDQHVFYLDNIEGYVWPFEDEYIQIKGYQDSFSPNLRHINNVNAVKVRCLDEYSKTPIISVDELAMAYLSGLDKELVKLIGGKAYGLTVLKAKGANIPETYVSPVTITDLSPDAVKSLPDFQYAVRSSADIEDGSQHSFAGMFDSFLDVKQNDIISAYSGVKSSVESPRVAAYLAVNKLENPHMAVVLQKFKEPEISGVWIGSSPTAGVLEWVEGNGEKLVSGHITPHHEEFNDDKEIADGVSVGSQSIGKQLIELQQKVSQTGTADFEWCVLDNQLVMLQFRPVTTEITQQNSPMMEEPVNNDRTFKGLAVSPGKVEGKAKFVRKINELDKWDDGDILMAWFTDPEWMHVLSKSSGIVTAVGGFLCHTAIIARELGIPCVVGIGGDSMKKIWNRTYLRIDGTKGVVSTDRPTSDKTLDIRKLKNAENIK